MQLRLILRDETGHQTIEGPDGWLTLDQAIEVLRRMKERETQTVPAAAPVAPRVEE